MPLHGTPVVAVSPVPCTRHLPPAHHAHVIRASHECPHDASVRGAILVLLRMATCGLCSWPLSWDLQQSSHRPWYQNSSQTCFLVIRSNCDHKEVFSSYKNSTNIESLTNLEGLIIL